jgi:hypothetical protein
MRSSALAPVLALTLMAGCGDGSTAVLLPPGTFTGTIQIRNGTTIPANARLVAVWQVTSGSPDYAYVYGSGTVSSDGAFSIAFPEDPPAEALNSGQLGVALLILTTDQTLAQGKLPNDYAFSGVIGMTENYSIIFTRNLSGPYAQGWPLRFSGYGAGEVERATTGFDSFKAVGADALRIVVDDLSKIDTPNWT